MNLFLTKISDDVKIPTFSHGPMEDAGRDLISTVDEVLQPGEFKMIPTGIKLALPPGLEGQVRPRSGLAAKFGVTVLNSPGTIDPSYRGEVKVILINHGKQPFTVKAGDRIAQLVITAYNMQPLNLISSEQFEALNETDRGEEGFGSTGLQ